MSTYKKKKDFSNKFIVPVVSAGYTVIGLENEKDSMIKYIHELKKNPKGHYVIYKQHPDTGEHTIIAHGYYDERDQKYIFHITQEYVNRAREAGLYKGLHPHSLEYEDPHKALKEIAQKIATSHHSGELYGDVELTKIGDKEWKVDGKPATQEAIYKKIIENKKKKKYVGVHVQ